ncbi:hypothetical protein PT273_08220 [Orbaceae bacterium ESL0727]|nr:hypothetical protein [Orbaceae bacterium ESL0727]
MIKILDRLKCDLINILPNKEKQIDLNIFDLIETHEKYINEFKQAILLLDKTIENNDEIAIQCALTRVRLAALNLSNDYQDIIDDVILVNQDKSWKSIPEDYKLPEIYNDYLVKK